MPEMYANTSPGMSVILWPHFVPVIEADGGDVGMAEPLLHLAMSASYARALVAAVARIECTHSPLTSIFKPVTCPYFLTIFR